MDYNDQLENSQFSNQPTNPSQVNSQQMGGETRQQGEPMRQNPQQPTSVDRSSVLQGMSAPRPSQGPGAQPTSSASRPAAGEPRVAPTAPPEAPWAKRVNVNPFNSKQEMPRREEPKNWKEKIVLYFKTMTWRKAFDLAVYFFAAAGFMVFAMWAAHGLGLTKNHGGYDSNQRYLTSAEDVKSVRDSSFSQVEIDEMWANQYMRLAAFAKFYPQNARIILNAIQYSSDPQIVDRMIAAAMGYGEHNRECQKFMEDMSSRAKKQKQYNQGNAIPWMDGVAWQHLKRSIIKDTADLYRAAEITGVEPRLIAACLVGEQIRLYNSRRESLKKYLGPVKTLSVESNFSYGVNGIKDFTAAAVEAHLVDPKSPYYMGKRYQHILDFETDNHAEERYRRLVDYKSHLYSYIYTGCILHQTMLQWRRAGYDISNRPDVLCTLFNLGFSKSKPHADPRCGGAAVNIEGRTYTFGAIGYDFYYSGELAEYLGYWPVHFIDDDGKALSQSDIKRIQDTRSDCDRPERGHEYKTDSAAASTTNATSSNDGVSSSSPSDDDDELISF